MEGSPRQSLSSALWFVLPVATRFAAMEGDVLTTSQLLPGADGTLPAGTAAYETRGTAVTVPEWLVDKCIQCGTCSLVCPQACIRPSYASEEVMKGAPEGYQTKPATGKEFAGMQYRMQVSPLDCTGCGSCAQVCPGMKGEKALVMKPIDTQRPGQKVFDYGRTLNEKPEVAAKFKETTVKGSQFKQPMLEFSGACAGCGETPYAKLATQLFGDRMFIANATGCSSIWGGSAPATPYTVNKKGHGPAWQNSLFEDNAEFGFGMALGQKAVRGRLAEYVNEIDETPEDQAMKKDSAQVTNNCNES